MPTFAVIVQIQPWILGWGGSVATTMSGTSETTALGGGSATTELTGDSEAAGLRGGSTTTQLTGDSEVR